MNNKSLIKILSNISSSVELGLSDNEVLALIIQKMCTGFGFYSGCVVAYDEVDKQYEINAHSWYLNHEKARDFKLVFESKIDAFEKWDFKSLFKTKKIDSYPVESFDGFCDGITCNLEYLLVIPLSVKKRKAGMVFVSQRKIEFKEDTEALTHLVGKQLGNLIYKREVNILTSVSKRNAEFFNLSDSPAIYP